MLVTTDTPADTPVRCPACNWHGAAADTVDAPGYPRGCPKCNVFVTPVNVPVNEPVKAEAAPAAEVPAG